MCWGRSLSRRRSLRRSSETVGCVRRRLALDEFDFAPRTREHRTRMQSATLRSLVAALLMAMVVGGCGGSEEAQEPGSETPTETATTSTDTTPQPTTYRRLKDQSGAISLEVPVEWRDTITQSSVYPGAHVLRTDTQAVLWAAADTQMLDNGLDTPGVIIEASRSLARRIVRPTGFLPRESGLWFFRHRPRLVLTRECPSARFDGLGDWAPARVRGVGTPSPGRRAEVPVAATGRLVQDKIGRYAWYGVAATWLCPGVPPTVVEILFMTRDRSTLVYMQFPLPAVADGDTMAHVLQTFRLRTAKVPKPT